MGRNVAHATNQLTHRGLAARLTVAAGLTGAGVLTMAAAAMAASVPAVPFGGPTSCAVLHSRFGGGAAWTEIRFSDLPGGGVTRTRSAGGVTVTITRTGPSTFDWRASDGIDLVWVNAGAPPHGSSAAYRYDPPAEATADHGLSGTDGQDPLDHVLFCFDREGTTVPPTTVTVPTTLAPPTTAPDVPTPVLRTAPVDTTPSTTPAATTATTVPATVRSVPVQQRPTPQAAPVPQQAATTTLAARLPETGAPSPAVIGLGLALVAAGLGSLLIVRRAPVEASDR